MNLWSHGGFDFDTYPIPFKEAARDGLWGHSKSHSLLRTS